MKNWTVFMTAAFLLLVGGAFAQVKVSGKVSDAQGAPIPGVTILQQNTSNGTVSQPDGTWSLTLVDKVPASLQFSFMGFITKTVHYSGSGALNVVLLKDEVGLKDVVVIGYGTQRKSQITGAISSIDGKALAKTQAVDLSTALQGQAPGVTVTSPTGAPGTEAVIRIRGIGTLNNSNPLFIVDGVPMTSGLTTISPNDIASMEVLKDAAAAAIYGSRAANGVILVTTKSGQPGKNEVGLEVAYGIAKASGLPKMMSTAQFIELQNEAFANDGSATRNQDDPSKLPNTNWLDAVFRQALTQRYNLSFSGGSEKTRYYLSGNVLNQDGTIVNSNFKRYGLRSNISSDVKNWLRVGENLSLTYDRTKQVGASGDGARPGSLPGVVRYALIRPNAIPVYDSKTGLYTDLPPADLYKSALLYGDGKNPLAIADYRFSNNSNYRLLGNVFAEARIGNDFKFRTDAGADVIFAEHQQYSGQIPGDRTTLQDKDKGLDKFRNRSTVLNWTNVLNYNHIFNKKHDVGVTLGSEYITAKTDYLSASRNGYDSRADQSPSLQYLAYGSGQQFNDGILEEWALMSYFGRITYAYDSKYLLNVNMRADASSRFSKNNRWGYFPSFSAGYNIARESFMKDVTWLNDLKIRGGWGQLGNQNIGLYPFSTIYSTANNVLQVVSRGNPDVKWETTTQSNIGIDAAFFKGALSLSLDYFNKQTSDILIQLPSSYTNGDAAPAYVNGAKMSNKGFEMNVGYRQAFNKDLSLNVSANVTTLKNKVVSLYKGKEQIFSAGSGRVILREGQPISSFFGYKTAGIFQNEKEIQDYKNSNGELLQPNAKPGDIRFVDVTNDGKIDDADRTIIGNPNPKFLYSLNASLNYKQFDLTVFFNGVQGNQIYNEVDNIINSFDGRGFNNKEDFYNSRWHGEGTSTTTPRATFQDPNNNRRNSDRYIQSGSYLRLKNIMLGYTLTPQLLQRIGFSQARVYVSGQNIWTITKYKGMDPELYTNENLANYGDLAVGIDMGTYPPSKTFTVGLQLSF
ncbi:TonB-linked SusC/RagA family outer membrane protein [Chitinophaga terrae (ex Kim and Jung 2007)]|uniref:SusC/RagA family TonB-linked outer membrane protein n=1 Tax=Chitinophaga terrae (ex Kim and Jung 2007) TaxID=408074 RepID=UPI002781ECF7|nr:TonB-dependent receptor [Chitinophaga terrae (ex Kim and Jung 2007)]MDQ0108758.1 TonB-linked SusC/RagA family outer membrane protein [Chitinophaga terrae (ex Kim and Jung 2007)]